MKNLQETSVTYSDNTYSSLQALSLICNWSSQVGEEIKQVLTVTLMLESLTVILLHMILEKY